MLNMDPPLDTFIVGVFFGMVWLERLPHLKRYMYKHISKAKLIHKAKLETCYAPRYTY